MDDALQVYARSPSSTKLMVAVEKLYQESNSITKENGPELIRIVMSNPLSFTLPSEADQRGQAEGLVQ